jgi:serine/threonine protein kinase
VTAPVREGEILAGKYRVDRVLGVGGMGVVVAAHHIDLDERVAIKFLLPETLGSAEAVARFAREARAAVKIKSEHVARVSDVGKLENGSPYMVMEYLEGSDLSAWLEQRGALGVEQAVEFVLQASEAIAEAHALGIVHRDLKPANLFVIKRPDGSLSVKVLDFGISKMTDVMGSGGDASMTKTSALMGSPLYMSPEQMQSSRNVDARTDIWALGVILYELVTGTPPFSGDSMPGLVLQIMSDPPPPLRNKRPDAPEGLEAVIFRCLDKDRGKRFESVGEMAVALLRFGPKRSKASVERISGVMKAAGFSGSALALPPSSDAQSTPADGTGTAASWGRTTGVKGRGSWMLVGGGAAVVAIGVVVMLLRKPASPEPSVGSASGAMSGAESLHATSAGPLPKSIPDKAVVSPSEQTAARPDPAVPAAPAPVPSVANAPAPAGGTKKGKPSKSEPTVTPAPQVAPVVTPVATKPNAAPPPAAPQASPPPKPTKPTDEWGTGRL